MGMEELVKFLEDSQRNSKKSTYYRSKGSMGPHGRLLHKIVDDPSAIGIEGKTTAYPEVKLFLGDRDIGEADLIFLGTDGKVYLAEACIIKETSGDVVHNRRQKLKLKLKKAHRYIWYRFDVYSDGAFAAHDSIEGGEFRSRSYNLNRNYTKNSCRRYFRKNFRGIIIP